MSEQSAISRSYLESGTLLLRQNDFANSIDYFNEAIRLLPQDPYAHWNKGSALLSLGDYENGFAEHDWGWGLFCWRDFGPIRNDIDRLKFLPVWRGERGARLLLYHEMGFGDAIMCFRYLSEVRRTADSVTLVLDPCLSQLAKQFDVEVVNRTPDDLLCFDYRLPLFGLMHVLKQTLETIPNAPYISGREWQTIPSSIGIAWSGRTQKMFSLDDFIGLLDRNGFELYSLQPGDTIGEVNSLPPELDFADVADRIAQMQHIVCVDTAAAHLAGAMGHPSVHLVLPFFGDWRWWKSEAWYPTIKTYRQLQSGDDWHEPFARINAALKGYDNG